MSLRIQGSSVGYDTVGLQDLINDIKIDIIPNIASSIRNSKENVKESINSVWVGASALAFKDKLDRDSEIVCNTLNNLTIELENDIKTAGVNVEELDAEIAKMFGGTGAVSSGGGSPLSSFASFTNSLADVKVSATDASNNSFLNAAGNVLKSTGATVAAAGFGLVEGLGMFGEAILDTGAILGTGAATIFTGAYDLITGSDTTKQMWDSTKGFVSKKLVKDMADDLYANTGVGRWVKDNAYGFDLTRGISSGVGYTGGIVLLTLATAGVGGAVAGGTAASTSAATSVTISAGELAATAGVAGFGRGTQDAWADGAGTSEGMLYGAASGAWEAAQFYAGGRMANFEALNSAGANVAARIGFDTVDGALEGFVQPGLQTLYKDESYGELFNANGGMTAVGQNALVGGISSAIGERTAISDILNDRVIVSSKQVQTSTKIYDSTPDGLKVKNDLITALDNSSGKNNRSNQAYGEILANQVNGNNKDAVAFSNSMIKLANEGKLKTYDITMDEYSHVANYSSDAKTINLGSAWLDNNQASTLTHEAGHALFDLVCDSKVPDSFESVVSNARVNALNDKQLHNITNGICSSTRGSKAVQIGKQNADDYIMKNYNQTAAEYRKTVADSINKQISEGHFDPVYELKKQGISKDVIDLVGSNITGEKYASVLYDNLCRNQQDIYARTHYGNTSALSDIVDAVFVGTAQDGKLKDAFGNNIQISYGHGEKYYSQSNSFQFHEMMANYNQLKLNNGYSQIAQLKSIFGKDFVNMLDNEWQKMVNY